jgi:DNA-binding IclR family transcriptional regulator
MTERLDVPLNAAQKSLRLVELLAQAAGPIGVSELARRAGGARGTVHKQLAGLLALGWVDQDPDGRYHLTLKVARIGNAALEQAGLGRRIHVILEEIASRTGESVSIAALNGDGALIVQRAESAQVLHANIRVGTRMALDTGASALVLSAFALDATQRETLREQGAAVAAESVVDEVRHAGVAHTVDALVDGISAVSVPLYDALHFTTVALTISAPSHRLDVARDEAALREGRRRIMAEIGGPDGGGEPGPGGGAGSWWAAEEARA